MSAGDQKSAPLLLATCTVQSTGTKHSPLLLKSFLAASPPPFTPPSLTKHHSKKLIVNVNSFPVIVPFDSEVYSPIVVNYFFDHHKSQHLINHCHQLLSI